MPKSEEELYQGRISKEDFFDTGFVVGDVLSAATWPWLRKGMGTHALATVGPMTLLAMLAYGLAARSPGTVFVYVPLWVLAVIIQRFRADRREHSKYPGWPSAGYRLSPVKRETFARIVEAGLVIAAGCLASPLSPALGLLFILSGSGTAVVVVVHAMLAAARMRRMRDGAIEQEQTARTFKRNF